MSFHDRTPLAAKASAGFPAQADSPRRSAAVLVPLFVRDDEDYLLFTLRTAHLKHHASEISFPGGGQDDGDADLWATALRETEEELGIDPDRVELHGRLDDFYSIHGYHVVPFVATIPAPLQLKIDRFEIEEVFSAPLEQLRDPAIHHVEDWGHRGRDFLVDFYNYQRYRIWGLTGAILRQFLEETVDAPPAVTRLGPSGKTACLQSSGS